MNRQFEMWLRSGETNLLSLRLERESYIFLRLPKRPGFDYLFAQRQYRGDGALHAEGIEYAGIYNAADGLVYDADYALIHAEGLDDTLAERSKGNLLKRLKQDVRALVERRVAGDRGNLTICELTDARSLERLEQYRKYRAPSAARELILGGLTPEDAGFSCHYRPDQWTEDTLLDYLADPLGYAEREAARFWAMGIRRKCCWIFLRTTRWRRNTRSWQRTPKIRPISSGALWRRSLLPTPRRSR